MIFDNPKYPKPSKEPLWTCPQDAQAELERIKSITVEDIIEVVLDNYNYSIFPRERRFIAKDTAFWKDIGKAIHDLINKG